MLKVCHILVSMLGAGTGGSGEITGSDSLEDELLLLEGWSGLATVIFVLSKRGLACCLLGDRCSIDRLVRVSNDFSTIWSELASSTAFPW
jgi:hypothetical protein